MVNDSSHVALNNYTSDHDYISSVAGVISSLNMNQGSI